MRASQGPLGLGHGLREIHEGQVGAALPFTSLAILFLLMGMAALAIDGGLGLNARRQDQSASDVGSLAAVQFAKGSPVIVTAANNGANEAIAVTNATLDDPSLANWSACTDPVRPAKFTVVSAVSPCVSFTYNLQEARVRVPTINVDTTFAVFVGVQSLPTTAFAHAQGDLGFPGGILPFAVGPTGSGSNHVCLKSGPNPSSVPPCDGPAEGNFGYLDVSLYGNASLSTPTVCGNAQASNKMISNVAVGIDHPLSVYNSGPSKYDFTYCPIFNSEPNELGSQTGNSAQPRIDDGLRFGNYGNPGRLARGSNTTVVHGGTPKLDDTPLWDYIDGPGTQPAGCQGVNNKTKMESCMASWRAAFATNPFLPPLFLDTIDDSARFALIPEFFVDIGNGFGTYLIKDFRAVYLQTTYWNCNANTCDIVFDPGEKPSNSCASPPVGSCGFPNNGNNKKIEALTAWLFVEEMLPQVVRDNIPPQPGTVTYSLTR